eukprot:2510493-Rhodomonas_salina.1
MRLHRLARRGPVVADAVCALGASRDMLIRGLRLTSGVTSSRVRRVYSGGGSGRSWQSGRTPDGLPVRESSDGSY